MLVGWIRTSIDPMIRSTVAFVQDAHKLCESLQRRFSVKNDVRVHQLRESINTCLQNGQTVIEYYGRLTKLWEELDNLRTMRPCTCEASADIEKENAEIRVHKSLFGLDESRFCNIRSQIIDEDPLPDINNVYSRVIREEQHNNTTKSIELKGEAIGFNTQADTPKRQFKFLQFGVVTQIGQVLIVHGKVMMSLSAFFYMAYRNGGTNNRGTIPILEDLNEDVVVVSQTQATMDMAVKTPHVLQLTMPILHRPSRMIKLDSWFNFCSLPVQTSLLNVCLVKQS